MENTQLKNLFNRIKATQPDVFNQIVTDLLLITEKSVTYVDKTVLARVVKLAKGLNNPSVGLTELFDVIVVGLAGAKESRESDGRWVTIYYTYKGKKTAGGCYHDPKSGVFV